MKTILVTGASSGIGFALVQYLLQLGYKVIGVSRTDVSSKFASNNYYHICFDLMRLSDYADAFKNIDKVDGIVHSAGIVVNNPVKFFNIEYYNNVIALNQTSPLLMISILLRSKKIARNASIVFISSINGPKVAIKGCAAYAASKCALVGIARVLALELSSQQIRVNCVLPGMVETELVDGLSQLSSEAIKIDKAKYPLGSRYAMPKEISQTIEYLISDKSSFITGQEIVVDGGYSLN